MTYPQYPTLHRRPMARRRRRPHPGRFQPGQRPGNRPRRPCGQARPRPCACCRAERLRDLARHACGRAQQDHAQGRRADARAGRRYRRAAHPGTRQAAGRSQGRGDGGGRHHRMVRRGRLPRLRPHRAFAQSRGAPDGGEGPGRAGGGVHALELPDQPGGAQDVGGARHRLLDHRQGARRNARRARPRWCAPLPTQAFRPACSAWCTATRPKSPAT